MYYKKMSGILVFITPYEFYKRRTRVQHYKKSLLKYTLYMSLNSSLQIKKLSILKSKKLLVYIQTVSGYVNVNQNRNYRERQIDDFDDAICELAFAQ